MYVFIVLDLSSIINYIFLLRVMTSFEDEDKNNGSLIL